MIAFFGASVTQQINGYVDYFTRLTDEKVKKFGYGGNHLKDAGICFIDEVVKENPRICFLDWFFTSYQNQDNLAIEYFETIAYKLIKKNCRVISLFLPNNNSDGWRVYYEQMKCYLRKNNFEYIAIDELLVGEDKDYLLKDSIHTTEYGANLYSEVIMSYLKKDITNKNLCPKITRYTNVNCLVVNKVYRKKLILEGNAEVIGVYNKIGPHSGIIRIDNKCEKRYENLWDQWCFYTRNHFNLKLFLNGTSEFTITKENFDTSVCKKEVRFSKIKKFLVVKKIYYIGELKIVNREMFGSILYFKFCFQEKFCNLIHKIAKLFVKILRSKEN